MICIPVFMVNRLLSDGKTSNLASFKTSFLGRSFGRNVLIGKGPTFFFLDRSVLNFLSIFFIPAIAIPSLFLIKVSLVLALVTASD